MKDIYALAKDLPTGKANRITNKLDKISKELKRDRNLKTIAK